jgi:hypothetical protein
MGRVRPPASEEVGVVFNKLSVFRESLFDQLSLGIAHIYKEKGTVALGSGCEGISQL